MIIRTYFFILSCVLSSNVYCLQKSHEVKAPSQSYWNSFISPQYDKLIAKWAKPITIAVATGTAAFFAYYLYNQRQRLQDNIRRAAAEAERLRQVAEQERQRRSAAEARRSNEQRDMNWAIAHSTMPPVVQSRVSPELLSANNNVFMGYKNGANLQPYSEEEFKVYHTESPSSSTPSTRSQKAFPLKRRAIAYKPQENYELIEKTIDAFIADIQSNYQNADLIISRYNKGRAIFHAIMNGTQARLKTDDIRDIMWFFYLYEVSKTPEHIFFNEGTFLLFGQRSQLDRLNNAFLNSSAAPYQRMSSHYPEWFPGTAGLFAHTGIDIHDLPPRDMGTLVFALDPSSTRMYIKPEPHGTARLADLSQHTLSFVKSFLSKNLPESTKNVLSFVINLPVDQGEKLRKERIPGDIGKEAFSLVSKAESILGTKSQDISTLQKLMNKEGIRVMYPKIIDYLSSAQLQKSEPAFYKALEDFYITKMKPYEKDWQYRRGNEAIFNIDELLKAPALGEISEISSPTTPEESAFFYGY